MFVFVYSFILHTSKHRLRRLSSLPITEALSIRSQPSLPIDMAVDKKGKSECAVTVDWASLRIVGKRKGGDVSLVSKVVWVFAFPKY